MKVDRKYDCKDYLGRKLQTKLQSYNQEISEEMSGPAVDQRPAAPDSPGALVHQARLPGVLAHLRLHPAHDPRGPPRQAALTVAVET